MVQTSMYHPPPQGSASEADLTRDPAADLDVGELRGGHHDLAVLAVGEGEDAVRGDRLGDDLLDALGRVVGLDDELTGGVLDADLDLHGSSSVRGSGCSVLVGERVTADAAPGEPGHQ